jgi:hypothetical protein
LRFKDNTRVFTEWEVYIDAKNKKHQVEGIIINEVDNPKGDFK